MKDITFVFSVGLILVLGIATLDRSIEKLSLSAATQSGHNLPGFLSSYKAARAAVSGNDRLIVVVFGQSGEELTERFKDEVLLSSHVNAVKELFVWAYIDTSQSVNRETLQKFNIKHTPITCVMDSQGRELARMRGFIQTHAFIGRLAKCLPETARRG